MTFDKFHPTNALGKRKIRRFKVSRKFDGAASLKIEISLDGAEPLFKVRPARRRRAVEIPLADVAIMVLERDAKVRAREDAAARKAAKKVSAAARRSLR